MSRPKYVSGRPLLGIALVAVMLVTACAAPAVTPSAPQGGTESRSIDSLTIQIGALGTEALDPNLGQLDDKPYTRLLYSYLFDTDLADAKMSDKAGVAESYTWSADQKALTVVLRKGVKFHDGTELKAEDVKFSIGRNTNAASLSVNAKSVASLISSI